MVFGWIFCCCFRRQSYNMPFRNLYPGTEFVASIITSSRHLQPIIQSPKQHADDDDDDNKHTSGIGGETDVETKEEHEISLNPFSSVQ